MSWSRVVGSRASGAEIVIERAARATLEQLERRALLSGAMNEAEPNDAIATANSVPISATPTVVNGTIAGTSDVDYFSFTLAERRGVFLDVDSSETGLSSDLDSELELLTGAGAQIALNDDGRDFDTITLQENQ